MTLFLAIDGGGTGCRAAVADDSGCVLGHGHGGPANIASDHEAARSNILAATEMALAAALGPTEVRQALPQLVAGLGLAGANAAGVAGRLRLALPFARTRIETDAIAAAKGALADADGIVAALGTGSVFAVQYQGSIRTFGGWGLVLGDEGGGAHLGRAALSLALRAVDGFATMTPFLQGLLDEHGGAASVVSFAQSARAADFAQLAPRVVQSADPAAQSLWSACTDGVSAVIADLRKGTDLPVTFIGGLGPFYAEALRQIPQVKAKGTTLDGAMLLAREVG
ncbi:BadF/BadG/BcrA/BcrD ATPase family protein [Pseudotabrizicola sp.]|uniref:BadF/BadG/BcrA/BcrD ATPase family protein n=1 Tax=Pseudotabrizicola sp. TaxID=2939647 RepID=UPI00271BCF20|nr:BadF/BadG/BcrA/BcrD ATPase family protein [Pseudotabrizicola sp.]MDO8883870.1 BadF/BadG/BcrA/BcrD ATPase family protein [Pseudotabrizicola sp.]